MPLLDRAGGRGEALELRLLIEAKRVNINLLVKRREITGRKLKKGGCGVGWGGVWGVSLRKGSLRLKSLCTSLS